MIEHRHEAADAEGLARDAADFVAAAAESAAAERGRCAVALAGGSTPRRLYERLAESPWKERVPWGETHLFWGDERCVPLDHADSNYAMARAALIGRVSIPAGNVHPIPVEGASPDEAARRYEEVLRSELGGDAIFDLILLGIGADGHTASLFPFEIDRLARDTGLVKAVFAPGAKPPGYRVTLTLPVINRARLVAFLTGGGAKRRIVESIWDDRSAAARRYPAALVEPAVIHWFRHGSMKREKPS